MTGTGAPSIAGDLIAVGLQDLSTVADPVIAGAPILGTSFLFRVDLKT